MDGNIRDTLFSLRRPEMEMVLAHDKRSDEIESNRLLNYLNDLNANEMSFVIRYFIVHLLINKL